GRRAEVLLVGACGEPLVARPVLLGLPWEDADEAPALEVEVGELPGVGEAAAARLAREHLERPGQDLRTELGAAGGVEAGDDLAPACFPAVRAGDRPEGECRHGDASLPVHV